MDLLDELKSHFENLKYTLSEVLNDPDESPSQKASLASAINNCLAQMIKMEKELYNINRVKAMEDSLVRAIDTLPEDAKERFLTHYEECILKLEDI